MNCPAKRARQLAKTGSTIRIRARLRNLVKVLASASVVTMAVFSSHAPAVAAGQTPYVVGDDHGGFLRDRLFELRDLRASGRPVEIRGRICYSTCTMFLGLPNACISPDTTFGFHGPSESGRRLPRDQFDHYSRIIAANYPQELNSWYMKTGRNRIRSLYKIKGSQIIQMGVRAC